jgi:hypothetical protein
MGEFIVSIRWRLGKALLQLGHLIGIKAQKWGEGADLIEGLPTPVAESNLSRFYDPSLFPEAGPAGLEEPGNLPETYGETRVVLLPVHPYLIHAYWELTPEDLERVKLRLGESHGRAKPVLRFYDITSIEFDGTNAHSYFDVEIDLGTKNGYVPLWSPGKYYIADLGFKRADGEYLAITRSAVAHTPRAWPSMRVEERYMNVGEERRDVETVPDSTQAVDRQADRGDESIEPEGKAVKPEPAAGAGKRLYLSKIPPPIDAAKTLSREPDPLYGPRKGEGFPSKTDEPRRFDFTELCEQKFAPGLSSRSRGTGAEPS